MAVGQETCTGGDHPTNAQGVTLCHRCSTLLEADLREVRDVWANLMVTAARMDKGAASIGSSGHSAPAIPCNFDAIEHGDQLEAVLRGWAAEVSVMTSIPCQRMTSGMWSSAWRTFAAVSVSVVPFGGEICWAASAASTVDSRCW